MKNEISPSDEAPSIVGNVLATLDCLFILHSEGGVDSLMDSTVNTLLGNAVEQLSKAYELLTTNPANAKRGEA